MDDVPDDWDRNLSALDYIEYCMEVHSQERTSLVIIEILDEAPEWSRVRDDVERATRIVLRMRQHVVTPVLPVAPAQWVTDPDFELDYHLRRVSLPAPGSLRQLLDLAQTLQATPLDLNRPLWEATVVEGLKAEDGAAAIVWKLSQPVIDGLSGILLDRLMHSDVPTPDRGPMPPIPVPEDLSPGDLTRGELRRLPITASRGLNRRLGDAIRLIAGGVRDPAGAVQSLGRLAGSVQRVGAAPVTDPSPLLRRRSLNRRFETMDVDLAGLRAAATTHGCSVHDAYLAAVCGGLRLYHEQLGVPVAALPLAMPIGVRSGDDPGGDLWTGLRMAAPIEQIDPVERMRLVRHAVLTARADPAFTMLRSAAPILSWLPVQMLGALGQAGRGIDVHVSSVTGQPGSVYVAAKRVTRLVPVGPLLGGALTIVACSMAGRHYVGVNLDPVAVADPESFMDCLRRGFDEVIAIGATGSQPVPAGANSADGTSATLRASGAPS